MSYSYSSAFQRVPNSTPQLPASVRPPIHNPYDKFTQPQFDEWIGGITSALRKVLGKEEEETLASQPTKLREGDVHPVSDTDEENAEDPFSEWKAMRAKEKGKMRATEDEQDSEYGGTQDIHGGSSIQDYAAGNTPDDAIELLSDDNDPEGEGFNAHRERDDKDHGGGSIESSSSVESEEEGEHPDVGGSQPAMPPKSYILASATGQQGVEIGDGETERHDQASDPFEAENVLCGWGQRGQGECQQPPDIRDPWELPKTYAEDLYTGGPIRDMDRSKFSPSHLTPSAEEADDIDNIDSQHQPLPVPAPQLDGSLHSFAQISQGPTTPLLIMTDLASNSDDEVSLYDEDILELNVPTTTTLRTESGFVSFTALNQPSDAESEQGGTEVFYISDNDGEEVSEHDKQAEEDELDDDGLIILGTSDLEIPADRGPEEDEEEELDELDDDEEPVAEVSSNPPYGYYGLDASSVTGSAGIDDENRTVGPPTDVPRHDQAEAPDVTISQESSSLLDSHNPTRLPAAATPIDIDYRLQPEAPAVAEATKVSLAEVSLTLLDDRPIIFDEAAVCIEDSVGDDTILADGAVLTTNEVEEVLRDAFTEMDRFTPTTNTQEGTTSISDTTSFVEEQVTHTSEKPGPRDKTSEFSAGLLPHESTTKDKVDLVCSPPWTFKHKLFNSQEAQKKSPPFVMPLIANPNVRDPMSAPRSPDQSGPSTPITSLVYPPAVAKFKRDNQLLGVTHSSSGLFTPLEGSGSSSPSPSDTVTPEDQSGAEIEIETPVLDDDGQRREEQTSPNVVSPARVSPEFQDVETNAIPTCPPKGGGWEGVARLPMPPAEIVNRLEGTSTAVPATQVFFQPVEASGNVEGSDTRGEVNPDGVRDDVSPVIVADALRKENQCEDARRLHNPKPMGNSSTVANDNDVSQKTPRLKVFEMPAPMAENSTRTKEDPGISVTTQKSLRKRKRSASPVPPEPSESDYSAKCKTPDLVIPPLSSGEHGEANHELTEEGLQNPDSDDECFALNLVEPRTTDPSSQEGSRASSVISEQPPLIQGHTPVLKDAPVFHGHGKFKAALQAHKLLRQKPETHAQEPEREKERAKEKVQEKEGPIEVKAGSGTPSENGPKDRNDGKKPPFLVLPAASAQPSLPSTSTSQSPMTPTSALQYSSTIITAPAEVAIPPHEEQVAQEPTEPDREIKKLAVKTVKRPASRKSLSFEPKSTRSQCRYRKISLPREENGPRVTFCVPQCSLHDKELMEEEDVTDDGLATVRDFERLWDHVEEQNLSPYLVGVIRQLVGIDLLRENEVYYLPTDEEVKQMEKKQRTEERRKSRKSIGGATYAEDTSSVSVTGLTPQPSISQVEKGKFGPPSSFAESVSAASTRSKVDRGGSTRSASGDEMTDGEGDGRKKRRRKGKELSGGSLRNTPSTREDSAVPSTAGSPAPSQSTTERTPTRRSRKTLKKAISTDTQAYRPTFSSGESSEDELENTKKRRRSTRGGTKGLKRRRTDGAGDSSMPPTAGDNDGPPSPRSTRSKRAKIDEK